MGSTSHADKLVGEIENRFHKLTAFYKVHAPHLVHRTADILRKYEGRQDELVARLLNKYGSLCELPSSPPQPQPQPRVKEASQNPSCSTVPTGKKVATAETAADNCTRLTSFYERHAPHLAYRAAEILQKFAGRENELVARLLHKYDDVCELSVDESKAATKVTAGNCSGSSSSRRSSNTKVRKRSGGAVPPQASHAAGIGSSTGTASSSRTSTETASRTGTAPRTRTVSRTGTASSARTASTTATASQSSSKYAEPDSRALNTPKAACTSVAQLAEYLTAPFATHEQRCRALFRWCTANIAYDYARYLKGDVTHESCKPETVLRTGLSVCSGYANLFKALCDAAGLHCVTLHGAAKGISWSSGHKKNHAWNAVNFGDSKQWQLVDVCWAAGSIRGSSFSRRFKECYWLCPPEQFIFNHFPMPNNKWQLLEAPITAEAWATQFPQAYADFFDLGMSLDHTTQRSEIRHDSNTPLQLTFPCPPDRAFMARLTPQGHSNGPNQTCSVSVEPHSNAAGGLLTVTVRFPRSGKYTLLVFGKRGHGRTGRYASVVQFRAVATQKTKG